MKKITLALLLFFSLFLVGLKSIAVELPTTLVVHYYRYDDNYTNFNMWVWRHEPVSSGGVQHNFIVDQKDERGVYLTIDLTVSAYTGATKIGIIIKQGGWDGYREVGGDRFIDLTTAEVINGVAHAYFVEQDLRIGTSQADLDNNIPDYRESILSLAFDTQKRIVANLTHIPLLGYKVYENSVLIQSGTATSKTLVVSVPNIDISKTYSLRVAFSEDREVEQIVSLQNLFDTPDFENLYTYDGDLGVTFDQTDTIIRLWAPLSESVVLNLYNQGHPQYNNQGQLSPELTPFSSIPMVRIESGAWEIILTDNHDFKYYTFSVTNNGVTHEVTDPYAYSTGANGLRSMIVRFDELNPEGWTYETRPDTIKNLTDYIIWELHVRDLTVHSSWKGTESYRGKFMGLTETGTTFTGSGNTVTTGLDHIAELGVNAVQLLPIFDFGYVDEVQVALNPNYLNVFNWGYMPYHFNTLEGSYATNPFDGGTRINEFKQVVMALHEKEIRVIMDVVYNHTGESATSNFHKIVPGYYHRLTPEGGFYNGSGTGNETASERSMMRKFMVDSVKFWATEYNFSGFRFDLMALHDVETMNQIQAMLEEIDPTIIVFGEPWTGGTSPLPGNVRADKENMSDLNKVGAFNDYTRDAIKGSVFQASEKGWVQGNATNYTKQGLMYGIVGGIDFDGITEIREWHLDPNQTINYVTAHDNNTLFDKLRLSGVSVTNAKPMVIQSNAIILTSQGVSFLHAGVEFMRSKPLPAGGFDHNSYESPDIVNQLRWDRKATYNDVFEYYKGLIEIRKSYNQFRINDADEIRSRLTFLPTDQGNRAVAYEIKGLANEPDIIVIHSGTPTGGLTFVDLPDKTKTYKILSDTLGVNPKGIENVSNAIFVPTNTSVILVELTDPSVSIKETQVSIKLNGSFDPASNVIIHNENATIQYSNYHSTSIPGRYIITVSVRESYGLVTHHHFMLTVGTPKFNVIITKTGLGE